MDRVFIQTTGIATQIQENALQLGGGLIHSFSQKLSVFIVGDNTFNIQGEVRRIWTGNTGVRVHFG